MEENKNYEGYLVRLKGISVPLDDKIMFSRIEAGIKRRPRRTNLILAGALAMLFLSFIVYFIGRPYFSGDSVTLAEYVFQQKDANSDSIMDYVLADR